MDKEWSRGHIEIIVKSFDYFEVIIAFLDTFLVVERRKTREIQALLQECYDYHNSKYLFKSFFSWSHEPTYKPIYDPTCETTFRPIYEPTHKPTYEPTYDPTYKHMNQLLS